MKERSRIRHDAEVAELDAREKFYNGQSEMLEKTKYIIKEFQDRGIIIFHINYGS